MRIRRLTPVIAAGAIGLLALPATVLGASATTIGQISGSVLGVATTTDPTFTANLDGGDATPTFTIPLSTQDTRGTGGGWNETVTSTLYASGSNTLTATASSITGVSSAGGTGTNTPATNAITYPVSVPAGAVPPTPVKFFDATSGTGMGKFTITPSFAVFVPQNTYAGSYSSTITIGVVSGP